MKNKYELPTEKQQRLLERVRVRPLRSTERARCERLLVRHHYLGAVAAVGEQLYYVAVTPHGGWVALLVFCAAAKHLRHREKWLGWTNEQRRRRLSLVVNNARFLLLPGRGEAPNLGSRVLRLVLDRLSADWQGRYGHPVLVAETFVNPEQFQGTVYRASGWEELGSTRGWGRCGRDCYVRHNKPKRLFVRELRAGARRSLQAAHLAPAFAMVEAKVAPRCTQKAKEIRALVEHFRGIPEYRARIESYPRWSLLAIVAAAHWCGAPRGQKDIAGFARRLSQGQRHAFGIRKNRQGKYPAPSQPTFCRLLKAVDALKVEEALLAFQAQMRGPAPKEDVVAMDGKEPKHSRGQQLLTAVCVPSQYYLGSEPVAEKTNEIPVARQLCKRLDLVDRLVGLDALHTQVETARELVQDAGADYILTVKGNQKGIRRTLVGLFSATPAAFSPSGDNNDSGPDRGAKSLSSRETSPAFASRDTGTGLLSGGGSSGSTDSANQRTKARDGLSADQPGRWTSHSSPMAQWQSSVLGSGEWHPSTTGCHG